MASPQAEPSTQTLRESLAALAVQVAALRGQITQIDQHLDQAGLRGELDLAARFEELAQTVADALDAAAPRGLAAPHWIGLDRQAFGAQLAELRRWADTVLRQHYTGYELRDCWPGHIHAIWELSTLAAAWRHAYGGQRPTWLVLWSFTTVGCPALCAESRPSPARAYRNAPCVAAPGDGPALAVCSIVGSRAARRPNVLVHGSWCVELRTKRSHGVGNRPGCLMECRCFMPVFRRREGPLPEE